jgi:ATP-dependent exoDNAse (exonuclease V) beta subunit
VRARLQLEPIAAARFLGRFGLANLERLFAELESRLAAEPDPARALATLRAAVAEEREAEEARPPGESDDAVSVMTIHTAKGLQFRHVYLVQAHKQSGGGRNAGRERFAFGPVEADGAGGRRREMKLFGAPTPGWREVERRRRRVAAAETARLLYVATTRAIDRLVICGLFDGGDRRRRPDDAPPSFAELLAPRIADGADETAPTRDAHGVLWRAAADGGAIGRPAAVRPAALPPPADRAELHERRLAAAARSARPRTLPASKLARADEPFDFGDDGGERAQARAAGVALHRALELAPLAAADDPAWREAARRALRDSLPAAGANELAALDAHLDRLLGSNLWRELARLEGAVLARELPLVAAADPAATAGPLDAYVGTLDLLYRDPESGETVIADFKSDQMDDDGAAAKLDRYRPQLELYARAVGDALALDRPPRLELWLLALDRIIPLPTSGNR